MSSLIFFADPDQAAIATDTLAVDSENNPMLFSSKALMLPHLRMVVAGTGAGSFADRWFLTLNTRMAVRDVVGASVHAPSLLRELWAAYRAEYSPREGLTTTIYHFGFEAGDGAMRVYAFRSANDFAVEELAYGVATKPPCLFEDETVQWPQRFRSIMDQQRTEERGKPWGERIQIGGEVQVIHLTRNGFQAFAQSSFDDYSSDLQSILKRHTKQ